MTQDPQDPKKPQTLSNIKDHSDVIQAHSQDLEVQANHYVNQLLNFEPNQLSEQQARKESVEQMGLEVQKRAAKQSELLKQPIKKLAQKSEDGSDVANALVNLKIQVEEI